MLRRGHSIVHFDLSNTHAYHSLQYNNRPVDLKYYFFQFYCMHAMKNICLFRRLSSNPCTCFTILLKFIIHLVAGSRLTQKITVSSTTFHREAPWWTIAHRTSLKYLTTMKLLKNFNWIHIQIWITDHSHSILFCSSLCVSKK